MYPKALQKSIDSFRKLPGVGAKTAERYAFQLLEMKLEDVKEFTEALLEAKTTLHTCAICGNITAKDTCDICRDTHRDRSIICVVQNAKDVIAMEKTQEFHGLYHVLNGVISTFKGILPEDINIDSLVARVDDSVQEVIIATNPTVEGETTALYLGKRLEGKNCVVSRLAHGLPMGGHLDYADELTLIKAIEGRKKL